MKWKCFSPNKARCISTDKMLHASILPGPIQNRAGLIKTLRKFRLLYLSIACSAGVLHQDEAGNRHKQEENSAADHDPCRHATGLLLLGAALSARLTLGRFSRSARSRLPLGNLILSRWVRFRPYVLRHWRD